MHIARTILGLWEKCGGLEAVRLIAEPLLKPCFGAAAEDDAGL